jgi:hypothetical protein
MAAQVAAAYRLFEVPPLFFVRHPPILKLGRKQVIGFKRCAGFASISELGESHGGRRPGQSSATIRNDRLMRVTAASHARFSRCG